VITKSIISDWFDKVRSVPIIDIILSLGVPISQNGKNKLRCQCFLPNHAGVNKSGTAFSINISRNIWYCFGCQVGGGNIEIVQRIKGYSPIESANFIAKTANLETYDEIRSSTQEERIAYTKKLNEQALVYEILTIAAHHFHYTLTPEFGKTLLIPQGNFDPKNTWKNLYETWGMIDEAIEDNVVGYDDCTLLPILKKKGYTDIEILKSGLFYRKEDGAIGDSVLKFRLTFPYIEVGKVSNFIARSTEKTWPCYTDNPNETLKTSSFPYAKYKKLPLYDSKERSYISEAIKTPFFGIEELRKKKNGVIVEGITDVILLRMFFKKLQDAGIKQAFQWGVGSFLSNQATNDHIDLISQTAKNMDSFLLLCDSESSGRGQLGAITTAKKMLEGQQILALIGTLDTQEDKIDPAMWVKNSWNKPYQELWDSFLQIVKQAKNVVEIAIEDATQQINQESVNTSLSYQNKVKKNLLDYLISLITSLPEIQQEDYLATLTRSPFAYKINKIKRLLKKSDSLSQNEDTRPQELNHEFRIPGEIPAGWSLISDGLYKEVIGRNQEINYVKVAEAPMAISEKYHDIDTGQYYLKSIFYQKGHWEERTESREVFMTSRILPGLAKWGFPTTSENAKSLVSFLAEYEAANKDTIKESPVVSSCGNKKVNGKEAFVLGKRCLYKDKEEPIEFLTPDTGDLQIVNAFESSGSLKDWVGMLQQCTAFNGAMLAIYTAFTGPFLYILNSKGFTYHMWGRSSIGKTIALTICASIYGDPTKLIQSWNQKEVATERRMALCNEVCLFLDEMKQAISREDIEKTLYGVTNGHGRGRGSIKGQQKTLFWLLPLISTGEMPATQASTDEGGQARVINVRDHLFGTGRRELVRELELTAKMNYGVAFPYFWQKVNIDNLKVRYHYYLQLISKIAKSDIAYRIGSNLATILAVGDEVNRVFGISTQDAGTMIGDLMNEILQDASTIDRATAALTQVTEWTMANEGLFYPNAEFKKDIAGVWKEGEYLAFFPYKLQDILEKFGYNYDSILKDWEERDWIKTEGGKRTYRFMINNKRIRLVAIKWEILTL